jgi:hypothetical protein
MTALNVGNVVFQQGKVKAGSKLNPALEET